MAHESNRTTDHPSSHRKTRRHHSRSISPHRTHRDTRKDTTSSHQHHHKRKRSPYALIAADDVALPPRPIILPFRSAPLSKHDLRKYKPMFASYLDIHKQIDIDELSEGEAKGRWKAFIGKWNRCELAEGWYDPQTLVKAIESAELDEATMDYSPTQPGVRHQQRNEEADNSDEAPPEEDDDDDWGPILPPSSAAAFKLSAKSRSGPTIPTNSDLALRDDMHQDDRAAAKESTQQERKAERKLQKERLDELAPRAEAGTRERQLEKKRDAAASNRAFANAKGDGGAGDGMGEVGEAEMMGATEGGTEEVKRMKANMARKKNEREVRREEVLRARAAEREERLAGLREREEKTMGLLKAIAKERFG